MTRPRAPRARPAFGSVRQEEDAVEEAAQAGRPGNRAGRPNGGTGSSGGRRTGPPTRPKRGDDEDVVRSIRRENDAAATLADQGYEVHQNPTRDEVAQARLNTGDTGNPKSKPDYLVEGHVFDCYSPGPTKPVRGIHWEVENKVVKKRQTQRMVVNLADWPGDLDAVRTQFRDWPIEGLKDLKVITRDGDIVQIDLSPANE